MLGHTFGAVRKVGRLDIIDITRDVWGLHRIPEVYPTHTAGVHSSATGPVSTQGPVKPNSYILLHNICL